MWGTSTMRNHTSIGWALTACVMAATTVAFSVNSRAESISDEDVARVVRALPRISDSALERAAGTNSGNVGSVDGYIGRGPRFNVDALPRPATPGTTDLGKATERLAREASSPNAIREALGSAPSLLVFVSFSMPEASLRSLVSQAERANATLVLRGPVRSSLKETVIAVQKLIGDRKVVFQLDPEAFDRFGVTAVPTFILTRSSKRDASCADGACASPAEGLRLSGDVSIEYAIDFMHRNATTMRDEIEAFVGRARGL